MKQNQTQLSTAVESTFTSGNSMTMTSQEIAELCDKQHKHVLTDIKAMLDGLEMMSSEFSDDIPVQGPNGGVRMSPIFRLPKDLTLTLVSGYSVQLRYKIIKRWEELEAAAPADEESVARLYLESILEKKRLQQVIASNVLYPRAHVEPDKPHISIKDVKRLYAPYLAESKIRLVLRYYGQGRTRFQFGPHENANFTTFQRDGLDEVFERFLEDSTQRISGSGTSVIIDHECFDGETSRVPRELAVECLGYRAEQFEG
jgi:phage regulator Rha-like protein